MAGWREAAAEFAGTALLLLLPVGAFACACTPPRDRVQRLRRRHCSRREHRR